MINALAIPGGVLPPTKPDVLEAILALERISLEQCQQIETPFDHLLHAGMYARTLEMSPGTVLTGALMELPTVLIVVGHTWMLAGEEWIELRGYNVLPASAGRKQVFRSISRTWITTLFPTAARSVEEAEVEITLDNDRLASRSSQVNSVRITEG